MTLHRLWPVRQTPCFSQLLLAIDEVRNHPNLRRPVPTQSGR